MATSSESIYPEPIASILEVLGDLQEPAETRLCRRVLAVGAHPDDIELGCAGALIRHVNSGDEVTMLVMTEGERGAQLEGNLPGRSSEAEAAAAVIGATLLHGPFVDGQIPMSAEAVEVIEAVIRARDIDTLYVHAAEDGHQDHMLTSRAAVAASRRLTRVLYYQSPSTIRFHPTLFVEISGELERKKAALACHKSQVEGSMTLDLEVVEATARYWGSRTRLDLAEPFETGRFSWNIDPLRSPEKHWDGVERRKPRAMRVEYGSLPKSRFAGLEGYDDADEDLSSGPGAQGLS